MRRDEKREAALWATLELIAEQGFHATPMSQIAERAGIGVGTIYRYFPSKDDLLGALYGSVKARMAETILAGFEAGDDVLAALALLLGRVVRCLLAMPVEAAFVDQFEHSPLIRAIARAEAEDAAAPFVALLARGIEEGRLKPLPVPVLGALIGGAASALARNFAADPAALTDDLLVRAVGAMIDGVRL